MSVVEFHDFLRIHADAGSIGKRIHERYKKDNYGNFMNDRESRKEQVSDIRHKHILEERINNLVSLDHFILDKREFGETWVFRFDELGLNRDAGMYFNAFHLIPDKVAGYVNNKKYNDFFQVTKIRVYFTSNAASNFAPINVVYIPPGIELSEITTDMCLQANKVATFNGKELGYMSINLPECMIEFVHNDVDEEGEKIKVIDQAIPMIQPGLNSVHRKNVQFDYGHLVFYSQNYEQSVNFDMYWDIDFYSGIDRMNIEEECDAGEDGDTNASFGEPKKSEKKSDKKIIKLSNTAKKVSKAPARKSE